MEVLEKRIVKKSEVDRLTEEFKKAINDYDIAQQAFEYATSEEEIELATQRLMNSKDKVSLINKEMKLLLKNAVIVDDSKPAKRNLVQKIANLFV